MRSPRTRRIVGLLLFAATLMACSDPAPAVKKNACPDSAQVFWKKFRTAVMSNDLNAVAGMTHFPLEVQNDMDSNNKKTVSQKDFAQRFPQLLNIEELDDPSQQSATTTTLLSMKKVVKATAELPASACSGQGRQFNVGNWTFLLNPAGWRFVIAHSNEF